MRITIDTQKDSPEHILHALDMIRRLVGENPGQLYANAPSSFSNEQNSPYTNNRTGSYSNQSSDYQDDNILGSIFNSAQPQPQQPVKRQADNNYPVMDDDLPGSMFNASTTQLPKNPPAQKPEVRVYEY